MAVARLRTNNAGVRNTHFKLPQVTELLLDRNFWMLFWSSFLIMICNGPISTFLPIIINSFGFTTLNSLLLLMPAGFWSGTLVLLFCYLSYKIKNLRVWLFVVAEALTILSCLLLILLPRKVCLSDQLEVILLIPHSKRVVYYSQLSFYQVLVVLMLC